MSDDEGRGGEVGGMAEADERWREVDGYDGWYDVSDRGRFRTWRGAGAAWRRRVAEPRLKSTTRDPRTGYLTVGFTTADSEQRRHLAHRVVLLAFKGPPQPGQTASHLNGDRGDNRAENLTWESHAENCARKREHGTDQAGERNPAAVMDEATVRRIREDWATGDRSLAEMVAKYQGVPKHRIKAIIQRLTWQHVAVDVPKVKQPRLILADARRTKALALLAAGERPASVAEAVGLSAKRVAQIRREAAA